MENITTIPRLFKHGDRHFTIVHETNAMINLVTEYLEQIAKAARETSFDNLFQQPLKIILVHELLCQPDGFVFVAASILCSPV